MAKSSSYSAKNVAVVVDGQAVTGFWDGDDAFVATPTDDIGVLVTGANGDGLFSQRAGTPHTLTLRLMHTSPTHKLLMQRWARQRAVGVRVQPFPVSKIDVDSGEGGATAHAYIQSAPADSMGVNAVVREWVLATPDWEPTIPA